MVNELRRIQLERIKKLAEMMPPSSVGGAVELIDGPYFTGIKYDFLDTESCARHNPLHMREYSTCLGCFRFDRMNMVCTVGRLAKGT